MVCKFVKLFTLLEEGAVGAGMATPASIKQPPIEESVDEELVSWGLTLVVVMVTR